MGDDKWTPAKSDYRYCETCSELIDFWKYYCIADTGHEARAIK